MTETAGSAGAPVPVCWVAVDQTGSGRGGSSDVHETFQAETETRPRRWAFCSRRDILDPRRDRDVAAAKTLTETYGI